jgi:hypothetical protein
MILDLLDHLEWYRGIHPSMQQIIDLLDRGEVYEQEPGSYSEGGIAWQITEVFSGAIAVAEQASCAQLQIILEGEELFCITGSHGVKSAGKLTTGLFVYLRAGETFSHLQAWDTQHLIKKVIFYLRSAD